MPDNFKYNDHQKKRMRLAKRIPYKGTTPATAKLQLLTPRVHTKIYLAQ
jgi:hypothetical protein